MDASEHAQIALAWLTVSDEEFSAGKRMQASEKLWGAVAHALIAVAMERGWAYGRHRDFVITVRRMTEETDDLDMSKEFNEARQFHANFYQNFLSDEQITQSRLIVRGFVLKVLSFIA